MKDSPNLDVLRASAVCLVVVSHLPLAANLPMPAHFSTRALGHVGVALFFVHTTLVLLMSLERSPAIGAFFVRRIFRLYPLSVVMVLLTTALCWAGHIPVVVGDVVANLLLVQNLTGAMSTPSPLWSLPYEVQMYLVLPLLFALARSPRALRWTSALLAGCVGLALITGAWVTMTPGLPPPILSLVPCFLPGVLAYIRGRKEATLSPVLLFAVIAGGALVVPVLAAHGAQEPPLLWALCLAVGLTIPACRQTTSKPLAAIGKTAATYSYGIYLTHFFAIGLALPEHRGATPGQWLLLAILLPALAFVAYRWIEAPGIRLGVQLADKLTARGSALHVRARSALPLPGAARR